MTSYSLHYIQFLDNFFFLGFFQECLFATKHSNIYIYIIYYCYIFLQIYLSDKHFFLHNRKEYSRYTLMLLHEKVVCHLASSREMEFMLIPENITKVILCNFIKFVFVCI